MPAFVAEALRADGWWLRSEIIWHKPNPMPESVTDRPTNAHEKLFLMTKSARYFYDAEAVRVRGGNGWHGDFAARSSERRDTQGLGSLRGQYAKPYEGNEGKDFADTGAQDARSVKSRIVEGVRNGTITGANLRNVWTIPTHSYKGAHFATFPPNLVEPCIKAGTSERGVCGECGAPWTRQVEQRLDGAATKMTTKRAPVNQEDIAAYLRECRERSGLSRSAIDEALGTKTLYSWFEGRPAGIETPTVDQWRKLKEILNMDGRFDEEIAATVEVEVTDAGDSRGVGVRSYKSAWNASRSTTGWAPTCEHKADPVPATVLDCFAGSGTTGHVALSLGRHFIGIEINGEYTGMARRRALGPLFADEG